MKIFLILNLAAILLLSESDTFAQVYGSYDWTASIYRRELTKTASTNPTSPGLSNLSSEILVGKATTDGTAYY